MKIMEKFPQSTNDSERQETKEEVMPPIQEVISNKSYEAGELKSKRESIFQAMILANHGFNELLQVSDRKKVMEATRNIIEEQGEVSTHSVIRKLSPDKKDRLEIYKEMLSKLNDSNNQDTDTGDANRFSYTKNPSAFLARQKYIEGLISSESWLDKLPGRTVNYIDTPMSSADSTLDLEALEKQLEDGKDLAEIVDQSYEVASGESDKLKAELTQLLSKVEEEYMKSRIKIEEGSEEKIQIILNDISKINSQPMDDEKMSTILGEALTSAEARADEIQEELKSKIKELISKRDEIKSQITSIM